LLEIRLLLQESRRRTRSAGGHEELRRVDLARPLSWNRGSNQGARP
jgi:hypothetical protein